MQERENRGLKRHLRPVRRHLQTQWMERIVGIFLMAVAYKSIYDSAQMVTGGFSGIGVIVRYLTEGILPGGIPMWMTNLSLDIPLFIAAYVIMGRKFVVHTIFGAGLLTFFLAILPSAPVDDADYLLAAVAGGVLCGAGIGLVLRSGTATGGTDLLAVVIGRYVRRYSVIRIMQLLDGIVILAGVIVFGIRVSLYAMIAIYITTLVSDRIVEGAKSAKAVWVISDAYKDIAAQVMEEMGRGVTTFEAGGMYSNRKRNVLLCVVSKKQIPQMKQIALDIDCRAFLIVGDVREVCGEGFVQNIQ